MPNFTQAQIPTVVKASSTHALAARWNPSRAPLTKRDLEAAKLKAHIAQVVAMAPPLTPSQLSELSRMLTPGAGWSLVQDLDNNEVNDAA